MTDSKENLQRQLDAIEAFIASPAHSSFKATVAADIKAKELLLTTTLPDTQANIALLLMTHGEKNMLAVHQTFFEDARDTLKDRIDECEIREVEARENQNK